LKKNATNVVVSWVLVTIIINTKYNKNKNNNNNNNNNNNTIIYEAPKHVHKVTTRAPYSIGHLKLCCVKTTNNKLDKQMCLE